MKKIIVLCLLLVMACISSCRSSRSEVPVECNHIWSEATCKEYAKCERCNEVKLEYGDHSYEDATCDKPKTCAFCGATEGKILGHIYLAEGTCIAQSKCYRCGKMGPFGAHKFLGGNCAAKPMCVYCGREGTELGDHNFSDPTCTEQGVCSICQATTEALGHDLEPATCTAPISCKRCEYTEGEALGHEGQGICSRCKAKLPITGSGYGDAVVSDINIGETGFYVLRITHDGWSNFIVHSYDANGDKEYLVNEIGDYEGTLLFLGEAPLMLNIQADGAWTYEVRELERTTETSFSGKGDSVSEIFNGARGTRAWRFKHDGEHNFIVRIYTADGRDHIINEIGSYDAAQVITIPADSSAFFEITADGNWEIYPE